ncbi:hypothetical protein VB738_04615 [Cyanobium gracile UHCC 0139]|uniref:Uncharacterized protein n=1 Tax=Cyanobium gracile UHCC 0139 TaxID=3110308 RepID=A0ABU5RRY2_9CYAN|nr:hypothetical protein [Cyanobium gracile]MEA5390542.1 hypothetical protein [Cyanobium gracile UHCC 0139]
MPSPEFPVGSANTDLCQLVAAAADLCRRPLRHAVVNPVQGAVSAGPEAEQGVGSLDLCLRLEARSPEGERVPAEDLELEIYRSGGELNLTLAWRQGEDHPLLWHGSHPVWMDGATGLRSSCPADGAPLEALARRLRALLRPDQD